MKQFLNKLVSLPVELWQSRKLIWKLAKNDFKTKYALVPPAEDVASPFCTVPRTTDSDYGTYIR